MLCYAMLCYAMLCYAMLCYATQRNATQRNATLNALTALLIAVLLPLSGCKKDDPDPCQGKTCLNGGTCVSGTCSCANGYTGANCETPPDACVGVTCLNGGYCANGACVCPQGYTGSNCSQQVTPTAIRINSIKVTSFPATDGGAGWDLTSGPDIYVKLTLGSTAIWESPNYFQNADPAQDYTFTPNPTFNLTSPNSQYTLTLYDYDDLDADDWMGGINFTPYSSSNGFPTTINLAPSGAAVTFSLNVAYLW
jgi:hypothetical protein